jgi:hypothetical protein
MKLVFSYPKQKIFSRLGFKVRVFSIVANKQFQTIAVLPAPLGAENMIHFPGIDNSKFKLEVLKI